MADWSQLGEALAAGGSNDLAYHKGRYQSAQTEAALAQADERRQKAIALEMLPKQLGALPGMTPELAAASGGSLAAGGNLGDAIGLLLKDQEFDFREMLGDPAADPNSQFYAGQGVQGKVLPRYEFGPSGHMMSDLSKPTVQPSLTPTGEASIEADEALVRQRDRGPEASNAMTTMLGLSPEQFAMLVERSRTLEGAKGEGRETGKGEGKITVQQPAAQAKLRSTTRFIDRTNTDIEKLRGDPSLWQGVSLTQLVSKVPGTEGARIRSELESIRSRLSVMALNDIRAIGGGSPGTITEREWPRFEQLYGALSDNMSVGDFRNALEGIQDVLDGMKSDAQEGYNATYANRDANAAASSTAPQAGGGPAVGAVEDGYRFKGGNPSDPASWEKVQ